MRKQIPDLSKRDVVKLVLEGGTPPYVPWSFGFTYEAAQTLEHHYGPTWEDMLGNHLLHLGNGIGFMKDLGNARYKDIFGVVWDRSVEKDIGLPERLLLENANLDSLRLPEPAQPLLYADIEHQIVKSPDLFRIYCIGFSLFERAWSMRGMENLLVDMYEHPQFVHDLLGAIADFNIEVVRRACTYDIDAVYFGDDWGQQHGLIMGPALWRTFIKPHLKRMYQAVKEAGAYVFIHSCGDVDELFEELVEMGLDCFNPFQPEVMDTESLLKTYRGKLTFHGGLSTQSVLPFWTAEQVKTESERLLGLGAKGGYIFSPAHAVEGDVPLENMIAFIDAARRQEGFA